MASEVRWTAGNHPTPEELLLAREDELAADAAAPILAHIHQCWQCRAHVEQYKRGIDAYLKFRQVHLDPAASPRPGGWLRLAARVRAIHTNPAPSPVAFWRRIPKTAWLAFSAAAVIGVALLVLSPAPLTAKIVLNRAIRAEEAGPAHLSVQRVLVRRRGQILAINEATLHDAHIDRSHPLSAGSFRAWHDSLKVKEDAVTTLENEIRVQTQTLEGAIALASLTVAQADYQPHAKHVELRDGITIDVEIIAAPLTAHPAAVPEAVAPTIHAPTRPESSDIDTEQREALEMEVRWALRRIDADLGEPLEIQADGDNLVVGGTLDDAERRDQIVEALKAFPQVTTQLRVATPEADLLAKAQPIDPSRSAAGPLLSALLSHDLPDSDGRRAFVSGALRLSQDIMRHTWALRRLAVRYPVAAEASLTAEARVSLEKLVSAHQAAVRSAAQDAALLWQPYVQLAAPPGTTRLPWQAASLVALPRAQSVDHFSVRLLAAGGTDGLTAPDALKQLRENYQQLLSTLPQENQ